MVGRPNSQTDEVNQGEDAVFQSLFRPERFLLGLKLRGRLPPGGRHPVQAEEVKMDHDQEDQ